MNKTDIKKIILITLALFFLISSFAILKQLKNILFMFTVGKEYLKIAKSLTPVFLITIVLLYSFLLNYLKFYKIVSFFIIFYSIIGLVFAYFFGHQTIGLHNNITSIDRTLGWLFYFYIEGFSPFIISVYWSFINSISDNTSAKKNYSFFIAGSRIGGCLTALISYFFMQNCLTNKCIWKHQVLLTASSVLLICALPVVYKIIKIISISDLEKNLDIHKHKNNNLFEGFKLLLKNAYVFSMFLLIFLYDIINTIVDNRRLVLAKENFNDISELTANLFKDQFLIDLGSVFVSLLLTTFLLKFLNKKYFLIIIPLSIGILLFNLSLKFNYQIISLIYILMRIINDSIFLPTREALYIPTSNDIKFKSKSWIDSFGRKIGQSTGGISINLIENYSAISNISITSILNHYFLILITIWTTVAYFLGKKYAKLIKNNQTIN
jgi:AAA family ATP:ADP antiporter